MTDGPTLVSTAAAARALGVSRATLSRWVQQGHLKPADRTIGGHMKFDVDDLRKQYEHVKQALSAQN